MEGKKTIAYLKIRLPIPAFRSSACSSPHLTILLHLSSHNDVFLFQLESTCTWPSKLCPAETPSQIQHLVWCLHWDASQTPHLQDIQNSPFQLLIALSYKDVLRKNIQPSILLRLTNTDNKETILQAFQQQRRFSTNKNQPDNRLWSTMWNSRK